MPLELSEDFSQETSQDCRCPDCLTTAIQERVEYLLQSKSITEIVEMARPFFQPKQLQEGIDYSIEKGNYVFSAWYHLKRGQCCGNGCKHCPYPTPYSKTDY